MSQKIKNLTHVSVVPKFWTAPNGRKIQWRSEYTLWPTFVAEVQAYASANNFPVPSDDELQSTICAQLPSRDCVTNGTYHAPSRREPVGAGRGCASCGKRR